MYLELIFGLFGEEGAEYVEIRSVLLEQDMEEFDLLMTPGLRFLFAFGVLPTGDGICIAHALGRFGLVLLLHEVRDTTKSMESMRLAMVNFCRGYSSSSISSPSSSSNIYIQNV